MTIVRCYACSALSEAPAPKDWAWVVDEHKEAVRLKILRSEVYFLGPPRLLTDEERARGIDVIKFKIKREATMEKYGVDQSGDLEKTAEDGKKLGVCSGCGEKLEQHGTVMLCPKCGSEPAEGGK